MRKVNRAKKVMAITKPVRHTLEVHEKAEELAIALSGIRQELTTKNEILREATELGLAQLEKEVERGNKNGSKKTKAKT